MIRVKNVNFEFKSKADNTAEIQSELNDIKAILLAVALKLGPDARAQLAMELNALPSDSIKQWAHNLDSIGSN